MSAASSSSLNTPFTLYRILSPLMLIKNEYLTKAAVTQARTHALCLSLISPSLDRERERQGGVLKGSKHRGKRGGVGGGGRGAQPVAQTTERRDMDE